MTDKQNTAQDVVEDLMTDPDKDAGRVPPPAPPQTVGNEPDADKSS